MFETEVVVIRCNLYRLFSLTDMTVIADIGVYELQSLLERGYELVSGGTENHLVLVNLRNKVNAAILSSEKIVDIFLSQK